VLHSTAQAASGRAATPGAPASSIEAVAIPAGTEPIRIDGELAEDVWTRATPVTDFLQRAPREGASSTIATPSTSRCARWTRSLTPWSDT
jgi:hypothetical protein